MIFHCKKKERNRKKKNLFDTLKVTLKNFVKKVGLSEVKLNIISNYSRFTAVNILIVGVILILDDLTISS